MINKIKNKQKETKSKKIDKGISKHNGNLSHVLPHHNITNETFSKQQQRGSHKKQKQKKERVRAQ